MKNQNTHNAEYMQALFSAILQVIEEPSTMASNTNRLRLIAHLAHIGYEGVVVGTGVDDFNRQTVLDMLSDFEAETGLSAISTGQPEAKALKQIQFTVTRLQALIETIHTTLHEASDDQVADAAMLAGWGAEIAGEVANDLGIYDMQRSKGKPVY